MTGNPEIIRLNLRYYQGLLTRENATYTPELARKLLEDASVRLTRAETEAINRQG